MANPKRGRKHVPFNFFGFSIPNSRDTDVARSNVSFQFLKGSIPDRYIGWIEGTDTSLCRYPLRCAVQRKIAGTIRLYNRRKLGGWLGAANFWPEGQNRPPGDHDLVVTRKGVQTMTKHVASFLLDCLQVVPFMRGNRDTRHVTARQTGGFQSASLQRL